MSDVACHILVIVVAALAIFSGWSRGFMRQVNSLLGLAFGLVCAHIFVSPIQAYLYEALPWLEGRWSATFVVTNLAADAVFIVVFLLFKSLTTLFVSALSIFSHGVLDSLFGAVWRLFCWLFFTSIFLNLCICIQPDGRLTKLAADADGNIAGATVLLAPVLLGCEDAGDLAHLLQLREASKIS